MSSSVRSVDAIIPELIQVIEENLDEFAQLLIEEYDKVYPSTVVSLLTLPERKALIEHSTHRLFAAFTLDCHDLAETSNLYPRIPAFANSPSAEKDFLSFVENDFFRLEVLLPFVLQRLDDDVEKRERATTRLIRAFKVLTQTNIVYQLKLLQQRTAALVLEEVQEERARIMGKVRKNLATGIGRLKSTTDHFIREHAQIEDDLALLSAEMNCIESELTTEVLESLLEGRHQDDTMAQSHRLNAVFAQNAPSQPLEEHSISFSNLTARELQVVNLVVAGKSNKEIAEQLVISEFTVKNHLRKIFQSLGLNSRTQLAVFGAYQLAAAMDLHYAGDR